MIKLLCSTYLQGNTTSRTGRQLSLGLKVLDLAIFSFTSIPQKTPKFCGRHLLCSHALAHVPPCAHQFLRFVITHNHPLSPSPIFAPQQRPSKIQSNILFDLIDSSMVSVWCGGSTDDRHIHNHTFRHLPAQNSPLV